MLCRCTQFRESLDLLRVLRKPSNLHIRQCNPQQAQSTLVRVRSKRASHPSLGWCGATAWSCDRTRCWVTKRNRLIHVVHLVRSSCDLRKSYRQKEQFHRCKCSCVRARPSRFRFSLYHRLRIIHRCGRWKVRCDFRFRVLRQGGFKQFSVNSNVRLCVPFTKEMWRCVELESCT